MNALSQALLNARRELKQSRTPAMVRVARWVKAYRENKAITEAHKAELRAFHFHEMVKSHIQPGRAYRYDELLAQVDMLNRSVIPGWSVRIFNGGVIIYTQYKSLTPTILLSARGSGFMLYGIEFHGVNIKESITWR
ncbi:hypothetical protein [Enterovibrio paralichthyis]|uniref:hypothetical protein n=1 Tax=Enterovibrio paralichthyis TaxID=2853805 RepID=UPI001C48F6C1|nr:hypothetical protein [Enterovibrio paralichthyis]MBV7300210.1 hypothetical protein [Enterovibrio paralichthyis]